MKKKFRICISIHILLFALMTCFSASAQVSFRGEKVYTPRKNPVSSVIIPEQPVGNGDTQVVTDTIPQKPDTILCRNTKKQHGWFAPMDTISKDVASHLGVYFRFTQKNKVGNWGRMECLDGSGNYVKGNLSPYIVKLGSADTDNNVNKDWVEKLKTTCIYEFISDATGKTIVNERAYDQDMNVVYAYSRVPIGNNQFVGSYKNFSGLPAEMRSSQDYTYGTLIKITEDRWGNDSILQFIDAKGVAKLNADSVAMEVYIQDEHGRVLKLQSRNADGSLAIDNWGNCGIEFTWDGYNLKSATYMDDKWHPMRMPLNRKSDTPVDIYKVNYEYDKYGRQTEMYFTDQFDNPDVNKFGAHRIVNEYDDKGNQIKQISFDKEGQLVSADASGSAIFYLECYEQTGQLKNLYWKDKYNRPNPTEGYLSKIHYEYDSDGNTILIERYSAETGEEKLCSMEKNTPEYQMILWNDGTSRIDSLDAKGRTTFTGFYDADKNLEMNKSKGWAYNVCSYSDIGNVTVTTEMYYDQNHNLINVDGYCKLVVESDSTNWTKKMWRYDTSGILKDNYVHRWTSGFEELIGQDDANVFGEISRSGGSSKVRYYKGDVMRNHEGAFVSIIGRDEFGEADYIASTEVTYCYMKDFPNAQRKYYDENNNVIDDNNKVRDGLPKVMTIEIVDSLAYNLGLRDNDVIILYGDYSANLDSIVTYSEFKKEWTLRSVLDAGKNKRMVVFRIVDASKGDYGLIEINGLEGTASELGFLTHIRYLTKKQRKRIRQAIEDNINGDNPLLAWKDLGKTTQIGANYVILAFEEMYREFRDYPYAKFVTDPAILLGACIKDRNLKWTLEDGEDTDNFQTMLDSRKPSKLSYPTMNYFLTKDAQSITPLILNERAVHVNWFDAYLSDEDYAQVSSLFKLANNEVDKIMKEPSGIPTKYFVGYWEVIKLEDLRFRPEGFLNLGKEGKMQGQLSQYGYIKFEEGYAVFKKTISYDGDWVNGGNWLFLPHPEIVSLECVDLLGAEEDLKNKAVAYINSNLNSDHNFFQNQLDNLTYIDDFDNEFYIENNNKKIFSVQNGYTFMKNKAPKKAKITNNTSITSQETEPRLEIEKDNLLIGYWEAEIPDVPNCSAELSLLQNGEMVWNMSLALPLGEEADGMAILMEIELPGTWSVQGHESFKMDLDPAKMNIDLNLDLGQIEGLTGEEQKQMRDAFKTEMVASKQEMAMSLLKSFDVFGEDIVVEQVDNSELVFRGRTWNRVPAERSVVVGQIGGDKGYLVENGFSGYYVVLEWCGWNCRQQVDAFYDERSASKENAHHLVLLPLEDVEGKNVFHDVIEITCPPGNMGIRTLDTSISYPYFKREILKRYLDWKMNR